MAEATPYGKTLVGKIADCKCGKHSEYAVTMVTPSGRTTWRGKRVGPMPESSQKFYCAVCAAKFEREFTEGSVRKL